ncbi:hypothetical protein ACIF83_44035 [Streptomyces sp. NPDC085866]|uniref:hypothetical protein n=1 Tax=Streptomyces sp. NPDC085866 TaxID=3365736 RepID=UPI0037CE0040
MTISTGSAAEREWTRAAAVEQALRPRRGARRPPVKAWLQPALISLVVVAAFIACYVGLQRDPQPHRVPVAVTGPSLPGEIQQALGDAVEVHPAADAATARHALERHDVVAVLGTAAPGHLRLEIAGAAGMSTTSAVRTLVDAYARGAGAHATTADVVPLAEHDARGLVGFYVAFGVSLAGFVLGSNVLGLAGVMRLRHRFFLLIGASAAIGAVGALVVGPVLGAAPAPLVPLVFVLALLAVATAFTTKLLGAVLGPDRATGHHAVAADRRQRHERRGHRSRPAARRGPGGLRPAAARSGREGHRRSQLLQRLALGRPRDHPGCVGHRRRDPAEPASPPDATPSSRRLTDAPGPAPAVAGPGAGPSG